MATIDGDHSLYDLHRLMSRVFSLRILGHVGRNFVVLQS